MSHTHRHTPAPRIAVDRLRIDWATGAFPLHPASAEPFLLAEWTAAHTLEEIARLTGVRPPDSGSDDPTPLPQH